MSKVFIEESTLTAIGDAIRTKTGGTELIAVPDMATEISGITTGDVTREDFIPDEALVLSGSCEYRFAYDGWSWFIDLYGDEITTTSLTSISNMFRESKKIEVIPFDIDCSGFTTYSNPIYVFYNCANLKEIKGKIINMKTRNVQNFFAACYKLRYLPEFENLDLSYSNTYQYANISQFCDDCYSLREISESLIKQFYGIQTSTSYIHLMNMFNSCYSLDEIIGISPRTGTITSNVFGSNYSGTFSYCHRLKNIIFDTQEDGTPYSVNWKTQTIDLSYYIGYAENTSKILNYNSGITEDKQVTDDTTYQALKDDADWWTTDVAYSRYNHDSAVATINSLPDTSAYLAENGGTNTITFNETSGQLTDGGACGNLTAEEIAVATAKGWTVTFTTW